MRASPHPRPCCAGQPAPPHPHRTPSDVCHAFGAAIKPYLVRPEMQQVLKLFEELVRESGRRKEQLVWLQMLYNKIITAA